MLSIGNNPHSLIAQHALGKSSNTFKQSLERLSSGLKVNRGADGPAALVISEKQRTQIAGLQQAIENTDKAVSLVQTAEGALNEVSSLLIEIRSLALDSANEGVNDEDALAANQAEIDNALDTIDRISNNTQFGVKKLLNGKAGFNAASSNTALEDLLATDDTQQGSFQVSAINETARKGKLEILADGGIDGADLAGLTANETLVFTTNEGTTKTLELDAGMLNYEVRDAINSISDETNVTASLEDTNGTLVLTHNEFGQNFKVQSDQDHVDGTTVQTGIGVAEIDTTAGDNDPTDDGIQNGVNLNVTVTDLESGDTLDVEGNGNVISAQTGIFHGLSFTAAVDGTDNSVSSSAIDQAIITVSDDSMTFQIGANAGQTADVTIDNVSSGALGKNVAGNLFANLRSIDVTTAAGAQDAVAVIDAAVDQVTNLRGMLGAFQGNTLESTANNLRVSLENTINAESIIRDTDFAQEISNFTKAQVLQQAGASVLSNANQIPNLALSLLG